MSEQVSLLFGRLASLAVAEGAVPEDGSGIDGVWTTTVPARARERDWRIAINADVDQEHAVEDFPGEGDADSIPPGRAVVFLGRWPAGVLSPFSGQLAAETVDGELQSIEAELIDDVGARIEALQEEADDDDV